MKRMNRFTLISLIFCLMKHKGEAASVPEQKNATDYEQSAISAMVVSNNSDGRHLRGIMTLTTDISLVRFLLFSDPDNPTKFEVIRLNNKGDLDGSKYQKNLTLKVITHGFTGDYKADFPFELKNALLKYKKKNNETFNIILVDWGVLAANDYTFPLPQYPSVVQNVAPVGKYLAKFLVFLKAENAFGSYDDVHLLGHSLGGHVSGVAGAEIQNLEKTKVGRITGLDPAGPLFGSLQGDLNLKLDKNDAKFVDVIYTSAGIAGTNESSGHIDIYPNAGGPSHKICGIYVITCPHSLAWKVYIHALNNPNAYKACKCDPWKWNENLECKSDCSDGIPIGESVPKTAMGSYYIQVDNTNVQL